MTAALKKQMKVRMKNMAKKKTTTINGEEVSEETLANLSNNKGEDE